jgi:hypothetical protein
MTRISLLLLSVFSLGLLSCGKVVQEAQVEKEIPAFNLTYSVPAVTGNVLAVNDISAERALYTVVSAYSEKGVKKEESWGRAESKKGASETLSSKAYTKKGLELTGASDRKWSKPELKLVKGAYEWKVASNEIRRGSPFYHVAAYADTTRYRMAFVDNETVSNNASVNLKTIELYDTFMAVLKLMRIHDGEVSLPYETQFRILFDKDFFETLNYTLPTNQANPFSIKKPVFRFERHLEKTLLSVWDLVLVDYLEAEHFVNSIKEKELSKASRKVLLENIAALKKAEADAEHSSADATED